MNVDTGEIYRTAEEIEAARARGERLAELFPQVPYTAVEEYYERVAETRQFLSAGRKPRLTLARK